jgi:hypothetical protein
VKTYVDEDIKQTIVLKLLEKIPNFPIKKAEKQVKKKLLIFESFDAL